MEDKLRDIFNLEDYNPHVMLQDIVSDSLEWIDINAQINIMFRVKSNIQQLRNCKTICDVGAYIESLKN